MYYCPLPPHHITVIRPDLRDMHPLSHSSVLSADPMSAKPSCLSHIFHTQLSREKIVYKYLSTQLSFLEISLSRFTF